jgi:hypothetical protein
MVARAHGCLGALLVAVAAGCGGGPCGDYCAAALDCFADECSDSEIDEATGVCTDACNAGIDAVDADDRGAMNECIDCIAGVIEESCEVDDDVFQRCAEPCLEAGQAAFEVFSEKFEEELDDAAPACGSSSSSTTCDVQLTSDGTTDACDIVCGEGDVAASCQGPAGQAVSCTCTTGANAGEVFSTTCEDLDSSLVLALCD